MSESSRQGQVEAPGQERAGIRPHIFVAIRDTGSTGEWFIRGSSQTHKVTISRTAAPQTFWRVHPASKGPESFYFQCFDGDGTFYWLGGNSSNLHTYISERQSDPGCVWNCVKYQYADAYQILCQDTDPGNANIYDWDINGEIRLSTQPRYWQFETFQTIDTLNKLTSGCYARFLAMGDPIAGNPPHATIFLVSGYETVPPLREVWHFEKIGAPSTWVISVLSDLNGPKYLAGDTQSGRVYLTQERGSPEANWIIEQAQPFYFSIRKDQGAKIWLMRDASSHIELKSEPWREWVLQPLSTVTGE